MLAATDSLLDNFGARGEEGTRRNGKIKEEKEQRNGKRNRKRMKRRRKWQSGSGGRYFSYGQSYTIFS